MDNFKETLVQEYEIVWGADKMHENFLDLFQISFIEKSQLFLHLYEKLFLGQTDETLYKSPSGLSN